jgi:AraC family transcriptional regulator
VSIYETIIQEVVDAIEDRLDEELKLSTLAQLAGFSDFHFHRVFQTMVGDSVMEYVRKRRLVRAACQVAYTDEKLLNIALDHGFGTPETFIRAFRRLYGMTPGEFRRKGLQPPEYPKVSVMEPRYNPYLGGIAMNYEIVTKPAFDLIGYSLRTRNKDGQNNRDIPAFWQRYMAEKKGETLYGLAVSTAELGVCDEFDIETGEFSYVIGVEAQEGAEPPEGAVRRHYPEQMYAVFTTPAVPRAEFTAAIQSTWHSIYSEWFPHSGYEQALGAEFEYYDERCWGDRTDHPVMDIYIPVAKKA